MPPTPASSCETESEIRSDLSCATTSIRFMARAIAFSRYVCAERARLSTGEICEGVHQARKCIDPVRRSGEKLINADPIDRTPNDLGVAQDLHE